MAFPPAGGRWRGVAVTDEGFQRKQRVFVSNQRSLSCLPPHPLQCAHWSTFPHRGEGFACSPSNSNESLRRTSFLVRLVSRETSSERIAYPSLPAHAESSLIPSFLLSPFDPLSLGSNGVLIRIKCSHTVPVNSHSRNGLHIPRFQLTPKARSFHFLSSPRFRIALHVNFPS